MGNAGCFGGDSCLSFLQTSAGKGDVAKEKPKEYYELSLAIRIACRNGDFGVIKMLTEKGHSLEAKDETGKTALFYAVRGKRDVDGLIEPSGGSICHPQAKTMQHEVCLQSGVLDKMVNELGANVNVRNEEGLTPLHEAARYSHLECVQRLVDLKADPDCKDRKGVTPLDIARTELPEYLTMKELACSERFWDDVRSRMNADRKLIKSYLQSVIRKDD
eukprot:gnl/MRDRNA2_/MRDRNA2_80869_c0_seq1.p1 gnl/MRDRNA2_/MRDRNA2_80869_c0~~gnl/MRDRNA2_/MRDRNA2_80869_c0_seq1.p1  ORF type:complete len:218 (+),score=46.27 gnl/MRDRNA2_/MRDRNA2_80869_c0_seq1:89-742(+)